MHVRRGDKLEHDAARIVSKYWAQRAQTDRRAQATNYIPFEHYLSLLEKDEECDDRVHTVFVATDDTAEVHREIAAMPKDDDGNILAGPGGCRRVRVVFSAVDDIKDGLHINTGSPSRGNCADRYSRNVATIADLMMLSKSDTFVGEFNSNWGRIVKVFRHSIDDRAEVTLRNFKVAFGERIAPPPGY